MLSRDGIHGRIEELEAERFGLTKERVDVLCAAQNPSRWNAWFDVAAEIMGADWRDLDADWWRAQFERERTPVEAIELFLEETV